MLQYLNDWQGGADTLTVQSALGVNPDEREGEAEPGHRQPRQEEEETAQPGAAVLTVLPTVAVTVGRPQQGLLGIFEGSVTVDLHLVPGLQVGLPPGLGLPVSRLLPPPLLGCSLLLAQLLSLLLLQPLLLPPGRHLLLQQPLPLPDQLGLVALEQSHHLLSAERAVVGCDAVPRRLSECRAQRVVLQVQPLQASQLSETHREFLQLVGVQVQRLEVFKLTKVLRELGQHILTEVQLGDVAQLEGEVGREEGQQVVREVETDHLPSQLLYLLHNKGVQQVSRQYRGRVTFTGTSLYCIIERSSSPSSSLSFRLFLVLPAITQLSSSENFKN